MARVAVLGAGQLGTFVSRRLEIDGHTVVVADVSPSSGYFLRYGAQRATPERVDASDPHELKQFLNRHAVEVTIIATGGGQTHQSTPSDGVREASVCVAEATAAVASQAGVRRLVLVSSRAVYGPSDAPLAESMPLSGSGWYADLKRQTEERVLNRDGSSEVVVLRVAGAYGPTLLGHGSHSARLMERLVFAAALGIEQPILTGRGHADEFLYVKDLAKAVSLAVTTPLSEPKLILNVGSGCLTTTDEIICTLGQLFPQAAFQLQPGADLPPLPVLDITAAKRSLGFEPGFDLRAGLIDYARLAGLGVR